MWARDIEFDGSALRGAVASLVATNFKGHTFYAKRLDWDRQIDRFHLMSSPLFAVRSVRDPGVYFETLNRVSQETAGSQNIAARTLFEHHDLEFEKIDAKDSKLQVELPGIERPASIAYSGPSIVIRGIRNPAKKIKVSGATVEGTEPYEIAISSRVLPPLQNPLETIVGRQLLSVVYVLDRKDEDGQTLESEPEDKTILFRYNPASCKVDVDRPQLWGSLTAAGRLRLEFGGILGLVPRKTSKSKRSSSGKPRRAAEMRGAVVEFPVPARKRAANQDQSPELVHADAIIGFPKRDTLFRFAVGKDGLVSCRSYQAYLRITELTSETTGQKGDPMTTDFPEMTPAWLSGRLGRTWQLQAGDAYSTVEGIPSGMWVLVEYMLEREFGTVRSRNCFCWIPRVARFPGRIEIEPLYYYDRDGYQCSDPCISLVERLLCGVETSSVGIVGEPLISAAETVEPSRKIPIRFVWDRHASEKGEFLWVRNSGLCGIEFALELRDQLGTMGIETFDWLEGQEPSRRRSGDEGRIEFEKRYGERKRSTPKGEWAIQDTCSPTVCFERIEPSEVSAETLRELCGEHGAAWIKEIRHCWGGITRYTRSFSPEHFRVYDQEPVPPIVRLQDAKEHRASNPELPFESVVERLHSTPDEDLKTLVRIWKKEAFDSNRYGAPAEQHPKNLLGRSLVVSTPSYCRSDDFSETAARTNSETSFAAWTGGQFSIRDRLSSSGMSEGGFSIGNSGANANASWAELYTLALGHQPLDGRTDIRGTRSLWRRDLTPKLVLLQLYAAMKRFGLDASVMDPDALLTQFHWNEFPDLKPASQKPPFGKYFDPMNNFLVHRHIEKSLVLPRSKVCAHRKPDGSIAWIIRPA